MRKDIIHPSKKQLIDYEARRGHTIYVYDSEEKYIENLIHFILHGIKQGYQLLIIEKKEVYETVYENITNLFSLNELDTIYFMTDKSFLLLCEGLSFKDIQSYFTEIYNEKNINGVQVNSWVHIPVKESAGNIISLHQLGEILTDENDRVGTNLIAVVDGKIVSASYQNKIMTTFPYFMTDHQIIESLFYMPQNNPSFTVYKEKKELESIIKATSFQLESFIMRNLDPVVILNNADIVLTVNEAFEKIFGWTSSEIVGKHSLQLPHILENEKQEVNNNKDKTLLGENVEEYESIRITKEGTVLYVMLSCFPLRDEKDKVNGRAVIIRDITEKKQAQELVIKTEKLSIAGELAAGIAHEIRNPVTAIKGFLQLTEHNDGINPVYYEIMEAEIERIELILSELLMLSKPQAVHYELTNIHELIQDIVILLEAEAIMNNVEIEMEFDSTDIFINCEKNQIKQVSINFIKNAIEAMADGGRLIIQIKNRENKNVLIRFIDEGCGIPDHVLSKLGQPFYTTKEKGTGLGFMVSKKIIENHNGIVTIASKENIGTTIEVKIPI
ncbi:ATP-binding protein [Niallia sp. 03133]|uniref:ATP-binding protein n=1 Tax=Niallia sp. 03133 TaxID=3458060 RepID=UPI004044BD1C